MRSLCILWFILFAVSVQGQKRLVLDDKCYEPEIRTVQLYPLQPVDWPSLLPAVTRIESQNLVLEFDDLREQKENYYIRLLHCNFDWSRSTLMDLDYMREYNEVLINDFGFSLNTHIPYVHYRVMIPPVKVPGNYVLMVYRDGNREDLVLSRRFMVVDSRIDLAQNDQLSGLGNLRNTNQALQFTINYGRYDVVNPASSIHVTVRQNQRWSTAKQDVQPSFIRENVSQIEYRFFDMENAFPAGNEFRFVDFRSLNYPGQNTARLDKARKPYELFVAAEGSRGSDAYAQYPDLNGGYMVDNSDYRQEPWLSANYLFVNFALSTPRQEDALFVVGAYNGWDQSEENKLLWNGSMYTARILMKQGFYNYQYLSKGKKGEENRVEGNHFQTENQYEVMVYYRPFQPNADLLIGYFVIPVNPR